MEIEEECIFQEDNDPKHKSHIVQNFIAENNWQKLFWPPSSPDLSPIENQWYEYKCKINKRKP